MPGAIELKPSETPKINPSSAFESGIPSAKAQETALIIQETVRLEAGDKSDINFQDLYKSLSITAQKIIDKLNELLKEKIPQGIQSLKPEDVTPEATADRIVTGTTAFFDVYTKQHPHLQTEELLNDFLDTVRGGIQSGYDDAVNILEGLGAFEFDGVKEGVEKTKRLIDEKLKAFEIAKRKEFGLPVDEPSVSTEAQVTETARSSVLTQAGASILQVTA